MDCSIFLTIKKGDKSQKIYIGSTDSEITEFRDIKNMLYNLSDIELNQILEALPNIEEVTDINIADISENSVGVLSPTDLFNDIKTTSADNRYTSTLLKLNLDKSTWNKQIVISGFGPGNLKTQYYNGHIFLNLNYIHDEDNKALAIFETSLYLADPDNYEKNSKDLIDTDKSYEEKINIIKKAFRKDATDLDFDLIKGLYDISSLNSSINMGLDQINSRDSVFYFIQKFSPLAEKENRELNYGPVENVRIENLKQGDLIKINYKTQEGARSVFEVFYDYFVDQKGDIIVKTNAIGKTEIYNRTFPSDVVSARKYSPEKITSFQERKEGIDVEITAKLFYSKYKYTLDLIKKHGVSVSGVTDAGEKVNNQKIKSLQGSTITLEDGSNINLDKVKKVVTNISKDITFNSYANINDVPNASVIYHSKLRTIPIGARILLKDGNNYVEGLVISKGISNNKTADTIVYITKRAGKVVSERISFYEIEYIIPDQKHYIPITESTKIDSIRKSLYNTNTSEDFLSKKSGNLRSFDYSVEKINKTTAFNSGDIIYQPTIMRYFKIVEVNNKNIILSTIINNKLEYIALDDSILKGGILFSKQKPNETFAENYFRKNGPKITHLPSKDKGVVSIEVNVYQKKNGFVYALDVKEDVTKSNLYSSGDVNINKEYKQYLRERFKADIKDKDPLYIEKDVNNKTKAFLHDQNNTKYWNITNFQELFDNLSLIVPGSFITFSKENKTEHNNAKAYIVEKVLDEALLLSAYHHTTIPSNYVTSEKFLYTKEDYNKAIVSQDRFKPVSLYVPNWATDKIKSLNSKILIPSVKNSKLLLFGPKDSPEIIRAMGNILSSKYNLKINYITNSDLKDFGGLNVQNSSAFLFNGEIFINIDKANIEEPVHEFLHLILANIKSKNPDNYYTLVNSVQNHPYFLEISKAYSEEVNIEQLEETFIRILTETFRNNILEEGFLTDSVFEDAMKESLSDMLKLQADLQTEDVFDLYRTSINELMSYFNSSLLGNEDGLIDYSNAFEMLELSGVIKQLIEKGNLKEICN